MKNEYKKIPIISISTSTGKRECLWSCKEGHVFLEHFVECPFCEKIAAVNLFFNQDRLRGYPTGSEWMQLLRDARAILNKDKNFVKESPVRKFWDEDR